MLHIFSNTKALQCIFFVFPPECISINFHPSGDALLLAVHLVVCAESEEILLAETNSHHLTLFIPQTALSPGLPSHSFPQAPPPAPSFSLPSHRHPSNHPAPPDLRRAFNPNFGHNEVVLADSLTGRMRVVPARCVALRWAHSPPCRLSYPAPCWRDTDTVGLQTPTLTPNNYARTIARVYLRLLLWGTRNSKQKSRWAACRAILSVFQIFQWEIFRKLKVVKVPCGAPSA